MGNFHLAKIRLLGKLPRDHYHLAHFLHEKDGWEPNHWYANWKQLDKNVWIIIGSSGIGTPSTPSDPILNIEVSLRDSPPNIPGNEFIATNPKEFLEELKLRILPAILEMLKSSKIPFEVVKEEEK